MPSTSETWDNGTGPEGLKFFNAWLPQNEAETVFKSVNGKTFPWNEKPKLYGRKIPQHAYIYHRGKSWKSRLSMERDGREALEILCQRIAKDFGCSVNSVYCNRFQDPEHRIEWHQDQYASHIFVLSLGGHRGLEFRDKDGSNIVRYDPVPGDLYFMSLQHNKEHYHRVLSAVESGDTTDSTRISFVFFVTAPFNKKEYKLSFSENMYGFLNSMLS